MPEAEAYLLPDRRTSREMFLKISEDVYLKENGRIRHSL